MNEKQKPTTKEYRENYDKIFKKGNVFSVEVNDMTSEEAKEILEKSK